MPFKVKKSGKGYKVFSPKGAKSKKPMSKEKALKQQKAIYANWDGKENNSKGKHMKITKEQAKKLLETAEAILKEYETYTDPETGVTWDDEGNRVSSGWRGGRHSTNGYNRRSYYAPRPTAAPLNPPGEDENAAATRIANAIAKKKGQASADQGLINWVLKQRAMGKLGGKAPAAPATPPPAAPPVAENMLENEVKAELLETAGNLLVQFKEAWKKREKGWGTSKTEKENDIKKDKGIPTVTKCMPKKERKSVEGK
jgi:hypothetical protein